MRTLLFAISLVALCGCVSKPSHPADYKQVFLAQEAAAERFGPGVSQWFYMGTTAGVHHLVLSRQTTDGRSSEYMTQVPSSEVSISDPFPVSYDKSRWRQIDSPAR